MALEYIYIARHDDPAWEFAGYRMNWVTDDWKSVTGTPRDPPLAALGITQAQELAEFFVSLPEEERPTAIFSSPYHRCLQTARPSAEALQLPLYVEHGLSEWYSHVVPGTGLHPRPMSASELHAYVPEIDDLWQSIYYPTRKGEDVVEVHDRAGALMRALVPTIEQQFGGKHKRILLVTHAAAVIALTRELVADRGLQLRVGCCTLTVLQRKDAGGYQWDAKKLAGGSHLKDGPLKDWSFDDAVYIDGKVINHAGESGTEKVSDYPVGLQLHLLPAELRNALT